jgi:hypothetical protein
MSRGKALAFWTFCHWVYNSNIVSVEEEANAKAETEEEEDEGKVQITCN